MSDTFLIAHIMQSVATFFILLVLHWRLCRLERKPPVVFKLDEKQYPHGISSSHRCTSFTKWERSLAGVYQKRRCLECGKEFCI